MKKKRNETFDLSLCEYLKQKRFLVPFILFCFGEVFSCILFNDVTLNTNIFTFLGRQVKLGILLLFMLLIIYILFTVFDFAAAKVNIAKNQFDKYTKKIEDLEEKENQIVSDFTKKQEDLEEIKRILMSDKKIDKGEILFNIAMGVNTYEPTKYHMLEEAAVKYHHVESAIYLANLYYSGLTNGKKIIIDKDYQKAYELYIEAEKFDLTGVAAWNVGWMYEHGTAPNSKKDDVESEKIAFEYYQKSTSMNYPKAYNSIGKFYTKEKAGLKRDIMKEIECFVKADEGGDPNALLNRAYIYSEEEQWFDNAIECYKTAIEKESPLAHLKFADFLVKNYSHFKKDYSPWEILSLYCKVAKQTNIDVSAKAYYNMGKILNDEKSDFYQFREQVCDKLGLNASNNIQEECSSKAYEILEDLLHKGITFEGFTLELYEELKKGK